MELQLCSGMLPRPSHFEVCLSEVYMIFVHIVLGIILMNYLIQNFIHLLSHMLNIPHAVFQLALSQKNV